MNNLLVSEITDSGHWGTGDSKDVWDHVSIEAVGTYTYLTQFIRYMLTRENKQNSTIN